MDQMLRLLHCCGLPVEDVDFINTDGKTMNKLLLEVGFFNVSFCMQLFILGDVVLKIIPEIFLVDLFHVLVLIYIYSGCFIF